MICSYETLLFSTVYFASGDDWECTLGEKTEMPPLNNDGDNVYGVNNLNYLQQQLNNYGTDDDRVNESHEDDYFDDSDSAVATNNATKNDQNGYGGDDEESSGEGASSESEDKHDGMMIPIPSNVDPNGLVSTHLQRLSQLIQSLNNGRNYSFDLGPSDLNQFLAMHKIQVQKEAIKGASSMPMPANGKIPSMHLNQILELQNQLKNLGATRDSYSTPPTPVQHFVSGNGYYPADATTIHIKASNSVKSPRFPDVGVATSQIVVNRPGGSVVFTLPNANIDHLPHQKEPAISEETLKTLLELSKQMSTTNQPPNIPPFAPPEPTAPVPFIQPIIRPVYYNVPVHEFPMPTAAQSYEASEKNNRREDDKTMQKISSVSGHLDSKNPASNENTEEDIGQTTIIHNHVPITIANPSPTNAIVNRYQNRVSITTTQRPFQPEQFQFDSYGNKPSQLPDANNYQSYPPYIHTYSQGSQNHVNRPLIQPFSTAATVYNSHNQNNQHDPIPTQYVQISQSRPTDPLPYGTQSYVDNNRPASSYNTINNPSSNYNAYTNPTTNYNPLNGPTSSYNPLHTQGSSNYNTLNNPNYPPTIYTPSPHLSDVNVNKYVNVDHKPFPTNQPLDYVPITSASQQSLHYINTPTTFLHQAQTYNEPNLIYPTAQHLPLDSEYGGFETANDNLDENYSDDVNNNNNNDNYSAGNADEDNDDDGSSDTDASDESSNLNLDQNNVNDENVMNLLANYNNENSQRPLNRIQKKPLFEYSPSPTDNHKQFVNIGGNFISLETYQNTIEPYLTENAVLGANIEVLTCATGVRQANNTDCTRYFVCNAKTGKVLSYACPPYTAFNSDTKICNAKTYSECHPGAIRNKITISENKRIQLEAQNALTEANKVKNEALKAQQLAHMIKLETQKILNSATGSTFKLNKKNPSKAKATSAPAALLQTIKRKQPPQFKRPQLQQKPLKAVQAPQKVSQRGKRKIPCRTEGKLADSLSRFNYFLCFKAPDGKMRARKMTCPSKLTFCARNKVCTSLRRCLAGKN